MPRPPKRRNHAAVPTHPEAESLLRPDVGTQAQFKKKKPPAAYRYDSSLSPALDWDGGNGARTLGEWLLARLDEAARLPPPHLFPEPLEFKDARGVKVTSVAGLRDAVDQLRRVSGPFLNWTGKAERLSFDVPTLPLDPGDIPTEVQMKAHLLINRQRPNVSGPGVLFEATLRPYLAGRRQQELVFELARDLTRTYVERADSQAPAHVLFPQIAAIANTYLTTKVTVGDRGNRLQVFMAPYYGWVVEILADAIKADTSAGEAPELPIYERNRPAGSTAEVDFWTSRDVREAQRSHVNYVVADTVKWEQQATYKLDTHSAVEAFVKNSGLGFAIPYIANGQHHDYLPDFVIRLRGDVPTHLILEIKGFDKAEAIKRQAATRWVEAVNAEGTFGRWAYAVVKDIGVLDPAIDAAVFRSPA